MKKLIIAVFFLAAASAASFVSGRYFSDNKLPNFCGKTVFYVYPDMSYEQVLDTITVNAGVKRMQSLLRCMDKEDVRETLKPGKYTVDASCTSIYVARMLSRGWQTPQNLTFSGTIRTRERLAKQISAQMLLDSLTVINALEDDRFLAEYGADRKSVFAYIIPDTYQMYWTDGMDRIMKRMRAEYDAFWTDERLSKAMAQGLSPYEVSIVASIVQGESVKASEYPQIAGVYLNRLRKGMKLEADPTVCYCYDYKISRVLNSHLEIDSPYNTYKYEGLPPSPINVPSKACLEAVLNPDSHGYLFFCASAAFDGTHKFSKTLSEHLRYADEFHRELNARSRRRRQASN